MARKLANRAEMTVASAPGTGSITLNGATGRGQTFTAAGISNGDTICYVIENSDATQWEVHEDVVYSSSAPHLARTGLVASSNGGSPVSFGADAIVYIDAVASDIYGARGSTGQIQYNNSNALAGATGLQTDGSRLGIGTSPSYSLDVVGTDAIRVPAGTTGQRPANVAGLVRYNSTLGGFEGSKGASWLRIGDSPFQTLSEFQSAEIAADRKAVAILGYYAAGDAGAMLVKRVSASPTYGGFRSTDRFLPDGSTDNTNGGYWIISSPDHIVTPEMFGAKRDGVTDDYAAIQAAINFIEAQPLIYSLGQTWAVRFTGGVYGCRTGLVSQGQGRYFCPSVAAFVDDGIPGCIINFPLGFGGAGPTAGWKVLNRGGGGFMVEGIQLLWGDGTHHSHATSAPVNGWWLERAAIMRYCGAQFFPGNGWHINGASDGNGFDGVRGFTDSSRFEKCMAANNGWNGFYVYGQDANVSTFDTCHADGNLQFGFRDHSFLGNVYINPHASNNGITGAAGPPCVIYNGSTWSVVPVTNLAWSDFQLTLPASTTPGTDGSVWALVSAGVDTSLVHQTWTLGMPCQPGGGFYMSNAQALYKPYWEQGQGVNWIFGEVFGGWKTLGWCMPRLSTPSYFLDGGFYMAWANDGTALETVRVIWGNAQGGVRTTTDFWGITGSSSGEFKFNLDPDLQCLHAYLITNTANGWFVTGTGTPCTFGSGAPIAGQFAVRSLGLGINTSVPNAGIIIEANSNAPTNGLHAKNWWTLNSNYTGDCLIGWHCAATGTPGTHQPIYGLPVSPYDTSNTQTASYQLVLGDAYRMILMNVAGANNLTVPASGTVNFPIGTRIDLAQIGAGQTTVVAAGGVTLLSTPGLKLSARYAGATLTKIASDTWLVFGSLSA